MVLRARRPYDANGNSLNDIFRTFTWDADGNPVTIGPVSLTYDALDRMVEQSVSSTNSEIVYSPAGVKLALMNGATLTKAFVPLTGGATAVYNSSGLAYYRHTDHLGSSRFASTPARTLYSDTAYSPYGEPCASSGAIDSSFTGQNHDTTAGLYDFLFREQDPNQGRWTSPDPAGLAAVDATNPQSWNRYAYVMNNPLSAIDPLGLCPGEKKAIGLGCGGGGGEDRDPIADPASCGDPPPCDPFIGPAPCDPVGGGGFPIPIGGGGDGGGGGGARPGLSGPTPIPEPPINVGSPIDPTTGLPFGSPFIGVDDASEAFFCVIQPEVCAAALIIVAAAVAYNQLSKRLVRGTVSCQVGDITDRSGLTMLGYVQGTGVGLNFQQALNAARRAAGALAAAQNPTRRVYVRHCDPI